MGEKKSSSNDTEYLRNMNGENDLSISATPSDDSVSAKLNFLCASGFDLDSVGWQGQYKKR